MRCTVLCGLICVALVACSKNSRSTLVKTCIADGSPAAICECNADAIVKGLPVEDVDTMAHFMAKRDARGLNTAMAKIGSKYPDKTKLIMHEVAACSGPNSTVRSWPVERDRDLPQLETKEN